MGTSNMSVLNETEDSIGILPRVIKEIFKVKEEQ
jgi:hypothetical protein